MTGAEIDQVVLGCVRALRAKGETERADALGRALIAVSARHAELKGNFEAFAVHQSWRCRHYKECRCGLDAVTERLQLPRVPTEIYVP
jgi:hypothetical protein